MNSNQRCTGRTTRAVFECVKEDGIYVVHSAAMRAYVKKIHPFVDVRVYSENLLIGETRPIFYDHYIEFYLLRGLMIGR